ncbi:hypothetical protein RhiirA4_475558 [Rhizophagus irregularis]|uniref:Uncharacterized protein n=1 Tax=Rhizophagus irregularis TaxID=588596 RepID=A0A2I1HAB7_9GLOM|nr:hypothetical protein RhiirA4_475558 [Rhizophagus irregularis]
MEQEKKQLPPLVLPGTLGDPRVFYKNTSNINLFNNKICATRRPMIIEDVTEKANSNATFIISNNDRSILNDLNYFLQQTTSPDNHSHSTFSDNSYMSAMESVATVVYTGPRSKFLDRQYQTYNLL